MNNLRSIQSLTWEVGFSLLLNKINISQMINLSIIQTIWNTCTCMKRHGNSVVSPREHLLGLNISIRVVNRWSLRGDQTFISIKNSECAAVAPCCCYRHAYHEIRRDLSVYKKQQMVCLGPAGSCWVTAGGNISVKSTLKQLAVQLTEEDVTLGG